MLHSASAPKFVGTALLLTAVVGSGIAMHRFSPNYIGLELLENSIATGAALTAIFLAVGPVSGSHHTRATDIGRGPLAEELSWAALPEPTS